MASHHTSSHPPSHSHSNPSTSTGGAGQQQPPKKIRAAHLLVKHRDSRRPSSWKEEKITRSKEEAVGILEGFERRIGGGEGLGDLAGRESDCSSARKGGDLYVPALFFFSFFSFFLVAVGCAFWVWWWWLGGDGGGVVLSWAERERETMLRTFGK